VIVVPEGQGKYELGDIGVMPAIRPRSSIQSGLSRRGGRVQNGDVILAAGNQKNIAHAKLIETIKASEGKPLTLEIERHALRPPSWSRRERSAAW